MKYKHYIITRFNLSNRWDKDKEGNSVLDEQWLIDRYKLFEDYCYPSIKSQSSKNFEWWVYFDESMANTFKEKNKVLNEKFENFMPKYKVSYDDFEKNMPVDIWQEAIKENIDYVITTRLDNDDVLAKDTVDVVQHNLEYRRSLLEIPVGYTLQLKSSPSLRKLNMALNPFISLVEGINKNDCIESVYAHQHGDWKHVTSVNVSEKPQWIQVIHDKNVFNQAKGKEVLPYGLKNRFVFNAPVFSIKDNMILIIRLSIKKIKFYLKIVLNR